MLGARTASVAIVATLAVLGVSACGPTATSDASDANGTRILLDLLNVGSPQTYFDFPRVNGGALAIADAAHVLIAGQQVVEGLPDVKATKGPLASRLELATSQLEISSHVAGFTVSMPEVIAPLMRDLNKNLVLGRGFRRDDQTASGSVWDPVTTADAYRALPLIRKVADATTISQIDTLLRRAKNPQLCGDPALKKAPDHIVNTAANALLLLSSLELTTCPAASWANLGQGVRALVLRHDLRKFSAESIEALKLVPALHSVGALDDAVVQTARTDAASAFAEALSRPDAGRTASDVALAANALRALTANALAVPLGPSLLANAARLIRWRGAIVDLIPDGQAARTVEGLWLLRGFAVQTGKQSEFVRLLQQVQTTNKPAELGPGDAVIWAAALGKPYTGPAIPVDKASSNILLATLQLKRANLIDQSRACPVARAQALPSQANLGNILRAAATRALADACSGSKTPSASAPLSAALRALKLKGPEATNPIALMYATQASCLLGQSPSRFAPEVRTAVAKTRADLRSASAQVPVSLYDIEAVYATLHAEALLSSCDSGWARGLGKS